MGCDAPELFHPKCEAERRLAIRAAWHLQHLIDAGGLTWEPSPRHEKYGRQLGTLRWNGVDVCTILIGEHVAVAYDGGRRQSWCDK
jgi:hypothetical protein